MQNLAYLAASVEVARLDRVQADFDQKEIIPSFSITPEFQEYGVIAHDCNLQTARPWSKEAHSIFRNSPIRCITEDDHMEGSYKVIAMPNLSEKEMHELLTEFIA